MIGDIDNEDIKRQVIDKLVEKNPGLDHALITTVVDEEFASFADRPVRDYLSILTERAAKKRLKKSS